MSVGSWTVKYTQQSDYLVCIYKGDNSFIPNEIKKEV